MDWNQSHIFCPYHSQTPIYCVSQWRAKLNDIFLLGTVNGGKIKFIGVMPWDENNMRIKDLWTLQYCTPSKRSWIWSVTATLETEKVISENRGQHFISTFYTDMIMVRQMSSTQYTFPRRCGGTMLQLCHSNPCKVGKFHPINSKHYNKYINCNLL